MPLAVTYSQAGDPEDTLEISEVDAPPAPGRGEIQVEVSAFSIHPGDLVIIGQSPPSAGERRRAGLEAAGTVRQVGPAVDGIAVGDRVAFFPNPGSWAQLVNVPAELTAPVPDGVTDDVAAQLVCNPITALMLVRAAQQHFATGFDGLILNNAAASAVGRLISAYADDHGIGSIGVVRHAERAQRLSEEFPRIPVIATDTPDWPEKVRQAAGRRPITAVTDPVGGQVGGHLFALLAPGGTLITYGQLSGEPVPLDPAVLMSGSGQRGLNVGRWLSASAPEQRASDIAAAVDLMQRHPQQFIPAAIYPLEEITAAAKHVATPGKLGTVVVRV